MKVGVVSETLKYRVLTNRNGAGHLRNCSGQPGGLVWLPDHPNSLLPRSLGSQRYMGINRFVPRVEAYLEPWTLLGNLPDGIGFPSSDSVWVSPIRAAATPRLQPKRRRHCT
jgi:hypothetical protein